MSDLDYRTWGQSRTCNGCRFWSEMLAQANGGIVKAACLMSQSPRSGKFVSGNNSCEHWQEGSLGAVDQPGGDPYAIEDAGEEVARQSMERAHGVIGA